MPNRLIKESIHTSETVNAMTDFQFRLWVNLITYVDDYGRGDARPAVIKGTCFPLRDEITREDVEEGLEALKQLGIIEINRTNGKPTIQFSNWATMYPEAGRHTADYSAWRIAVFRRDNYTCQRCGKRGGKLNAHHIKRYRNHIADRTNVDNGVTLCIECHKAVHHEEGK